jgi:hypothetical protein
VRVFYVFTDEIASNRMTMECIEYDGHPLWVIVAKPREFETVEFFSTFCWAFVQQPGLNQQAACGSAVKSATPNVSSM